MEKTDEELLYGGDLVMIYHNYYSTRIVSNDGEINQSLKNQFHFSIGV